ncbi:DUF808 family protein [Mycobacterium stomatepiae]|uniref:DUF808 family protein n=1 Tax=Mycobacterium stomatepiae TaxID=470076 RepID=UPI0021F27DB8|nr:DUF808 family protein [Mycobacterium stomatepiae]
MERILGRLKDIRIDEARHGLLILPVAMLFAQFAPRLVVPVLMLGGVYSCYEGAEKAWWVG